MPVQDTHVRSLTKATALSGFSVKDAIPPIAVIRVLNAAGINFVLVGAYGLGGWVQKPRATEDVDVIVAAKHHKKALKALLTAFPDLGADDLPVVTRLRDRQSHDVAIDVMKPNQQLFREAFKHTHRVSAEGEVYKVPSLEMALAMKFAPMVSPTRRRQPLRVWRGRADADKYQDAHDFIYMVQSNPNIDLKKLAVLGDLVYPEGGKEIVEKVRQVLAGEKLNL